MPDACPARDVLSRVGDKWSVLVIAMLWLFPDVPRTLLWTSLLFPAYYVVLSLALELRRP